MSSGKFSLKSRIGSFKFAFRGLWLLLKNEHNSRIHFVAAIVAVSLGFSLKINLIEWSLLAIVIAIVFIAELLNSSLETLADFVDPEWNEKMMKAKDYSAAAVLISAIISVVVGALIFIPKILDLI
jgi:diacylglycerol kinase